MSALNQIGGLAGWHVAMFIVALTLLFLTPAVGVALMIPLVVAQLGLANVWLVYGAEPWRDRCLVWGAAMLIITMPFLWIPFPLLILHAAGLALVRWRLAGPLLLVHETNAAIDRQLQFSLKQLMLAFSAVAIGLSICRILRLLTANGEILPLALTAAFGALLVVGLICTHSFALWGTLGADWPISRFFAALAVAATVGAMLGYACNAPLRPAATIVAVNVAQAVIFMLSLQVIRRAQLCTTGSSSEDLAALGKNAGGIHRQFL